MAHPGRPRFTTEPIAPHDGTATVACVPLFETSNYAGPQAPQEGRPPDSDLVRRPQTDVPYVGLFNNEWAQALCSKLTEPDYSANSWTGAYALLIRPAA